MTSSGIVTTAPSEERRCAACDEVLIKREGEQISHWNKRMYCNSKCYGQFRIREDVEKNCVNCGKPLKRRASEKPNAFAMRNLCGRQCRAQHLSKLKTVNAPVKECEVCGDLFGRRTKMLSGK